MTSAGAPWPATLSYAVPPWLGLGLAVGVTFAGQAQSARDSAGVRIVQYTARDRPRESWRLEPVPQVVIGGPLASGVAEFSLIRDVTRLSDGSIVALDYATNQARMFDAQGTPLRTFGRRGRGPGEFEGIWDLHRLGDTMVVFDRTFIAQVFTPDGRYLRTVAKPPSPTGGLIFPIGYFNDGGLVLYAVDPLQPAADGWRLSHVTILKVTANGTISFGRFPSRETLYRKARRPVRRIYGPSTELAVLPSYLCTGYSEQYAFQCLDPSGRLRTRVTRAGGAARRVTDADRQVYFEDFDQANPGPRYAGVREEARQDAVFATRLPAYGRFVTGPVDELWVGPFVPLDQLGGQGTPVTDEPMTWSVFSAASGTWLSDVTLPARFQLREAGRDYVLGIARDADEVETVVLYAVRRPAAR